jgi:hypothetical protein
MPSWTVKGPVSLSGAVSKPEDLTDAGITLKVIANATQLASHALISPETAKQLHASNFDRCFLQLAEGSDCVVAAR